MYSATQLPSVFPSLPTKTYPPRFAPLPNSYASRVELAETPRVKPIQVYALVHSSQPACCSCFSEADTRNTGHEKMYWPYTKTFTKTAQNRILSILRLYHMIKKSCNACHTNFVAPDTALPPVNTTLQAILTGHVHAHRPFAEPGTYTNSSSYIYSTRQRLKLLHRDVPRNVIIRCYITV